GGVRLPAPRVGTVGDRSDEEGGARRPCWVQAPSHDAPRPCASCARIQASAASSTASRPFARSSLVGATVTSGSTPLPSRLTFRGVVKSATAYWKRSPVGSDL